MSKRVAEVLVETLQAAGVKRCYGIIGDTVNRIAHAIDASEIEWVHMRHEEAGAFAASAEAQFTGELVACAGSCGPGSLHFINGIYEANRNRAPVVLIATQVVREDIGFNSIQEINFEDVYKGCSVFCEMILTPEQARRKTVAACQAALTKRGVAVLIVPADISNAAAPEERPYAVHARPPVIRPSDGDLDEIAAILNKSNAITIYAGAGSAGAHDEVVATAARLKAPMAHTSRGMLDLMILPELDHAARLDTFSHLLREGAAAVRAQLVTSRSSWIEYESENELNVNLDGEPTLVKRFRVECRRRVLPVHLGDSPLISSRETIV